MEWVYLGGHVPRRFLDAPLFLEQVMVASEHPWMIV